MCLILSKSIILFTKLDKLKSLIKKLNGPTLVNVITVGLFTVFVKGFGFGKEILIAENFGLSELLDTFYIAFLAPSLIYNIFLGSFKSVFIPNYVGTLKSNKLIIGSF